MHFTFATLLYAVALTPLVASAAQPAAAGHPAAPDAPTPPVSYESAFTGYQSFRDEKLAPWREVNDEVGRVGGQAGIFGGAGHAGHGGAKSVTSTPPPAAAKPQAPRPMTHGPDHQGMTK